MSTNANDGDASREERDDDAVMDWALGERVGGDLPPDLVAGVQARLAAVHVGASRGMPARGSRWWAAAIVLLGALVVIGVATWPRERGDSAPASSQDRAMPKPVSVHSLADVAALPVTTRAVEAIGVDDAVIAALADRVRDLEVLIVREPWNEAFGLGLKTTPPKPVLHVTAAVWDSVFRLKKLRHIEFSGCVLAGRVGPERMAGFALGLESLPGIEALTLRCLDTKDAVLQVLGKARSLRRLDLSFNHGFGDDGVRAITTLTTLRSLSLRGCQQLHGNVLALLSALPELEDLDLSAIDGLNWRAGTGEVDDDEARATRLLAQRRGDRLGMGPTDTALEAFAHLPKLRVLDISGGHYITGRGLAALGRCTTLRELDASGMREDGGEWVRALPAQLERLEVGGEHDDAFCIAVAERLTALRHLTIAACDRITDRGLDAVAAMPSLRVLDMRQMRGLTANCIDPLANATHLEELDVRHCDFVTAEHVVQLQRSLPGLKTLQTSVDPERIAAAARLQFRARVASREQIERLPAGQLAVEGIGIDDDCLAALTRLRAIEHLVLRPVGSKRVDAPLPQGPVAPITDAGLAHLAKLPALRFLHLDRARGVTSEGLASLARLPLRELHCQVMVVDDAALVALAGMPLESLRLSNCRGFGSDGLAAIAAMATLREVALVGCVHVDEHWLEQLGKLPNLGRLDLSYIGSRTHFSGLSEFGDHVEPGSGVTGRVLAALGELRSLRELSLAYGAVDGAGLRALRPIASLQSLDLSGTPVRAADLAELPPRLTRLVLGNCADLGQDFGAILAEATPRLEHLGLAHSPLLEDTCLQSLRAVRSLRTLDLSWCDRLTAVAADHLAAMPWLRELKLFGLVAFGESELAKLRAMPNLQSLETEKGREVLRK